MMRPVLFAVGLLLGSTAASKEGGVDRASLAQFIPSGWEAGDCPKSYGPDSVVCAGTDRGPFKVDHHVPTVWIRAPHGACASARQAARRDAGHKGLALTRESEGRCGAPGAPCSEQSYRRSSSDAPLLLEYVRCPAKGPPLIVAYAVSSRVSTEFQAFARRQVAWADGQQPALHTDSIRIGTEASLEPSNDAILPLVRSHREEIERCRAEAIAAGRVPTGKLVARWRIGADGHVLSAEAVSDATKDPTLAACVLARIRTWEFPRPKGGGEMFVTCPFDFLEAG